MSLKKKLRENKLVGPAYRKVKEASVEIKRRERLRYTGQFIDNSIGSEYLCVVLAGYKEFLYPASLGRLQRYAMQGMDICIITSGLYSEAVCELCVENHWSYLSTKENNVSLVQNVAINLHPKAQMIFKLDEDIMIPEFYFEHMLEAYKAAREGEYVVGVLAPILPINGYGYMRVLEKTGTKVIFEERFEAAKYHAGCEWMIENSPEVARFFWGEGGMIPSIDEMSRRFWEKPLEARPCPIRFSIGAILFERKLWEDMGYFEVSRFGNSLGQDEKQLCAFCCLRSRPLMVSENIVAGHLSFGTQNAAMKEYYLSHKEFFCN